MGGSDGASNESCADRRSSRELFRLLLLLLFRRRLFVVVVAGAIGVDNKLFVAIELMFCLLAEIGDGVGITSTKFDGKTPVLPFNRPRHQPSST